jgi:DNA repair exonuclease SbcCD nuclease subunit
MKFLITGDWHIDHNRPERRVDDYWETVKRKVQWIIELKQKEGCISILQPGDFFNSHKANDFLKRWVIACLKYTGVSINEVMMNTVFGQHDLRYHSSDIKNTPLSVLDVSGVIAIAGPDPINLGPVHIYGASWYEDIPEPLATNVINILITHRMIVKNKKVWEGQEDVTFGNILLKTSGFDLTVSGDNHQHFTISSKSGKHLVNCGSLLRTNIDQVDHTPIVYVYDTAQRTITPHEIPCEPFDKVFNMAVYEDEKEKDEKMEAFVERLTGDVELEGLDFIKNMDTFMSKQEDLDDVTVGIIEEVMA